MTLKKTFQKTVNMIMFMPGWLFHSPLMYETEKLMISRYLAYAIKDWPRLIKQVYHTTKPGGLVEFTDYDLQ